VMEKGLSSPCSPRIPFCHGFCYLRLLPAILSVCLSGSLLVACFSVSPIEGEGMIGSVSHYPVAWSFCGPLCEAMCGFLCYLALGRLAINNKDGGHTTPGPIRRGCGWGSTPGRLFCVAGLCLLLGS
jgi:hypothetical protein